MKFGVQYYPEQWPRERWAIDAEMMQRAGVNVVRMGEFAWSAYEPKEGQVAFSWMEEAIALMGEHGIKTIMCTCSRTPPPWAYARYPAIANVWKDGSSNSCDSRYGVALGNKDFIKLSQGIDSKVIQHFSGNPNIIAWQVDNEIGSANDSFGPSDREAFQSYLNEKYQTIEKLNEAWGRHFWSFTFSDFEEVPLPKRNPQLSLEYRRFLSKMNVDFARWRTERIHGCDPGKLVTTNFQNIYSSHTDWNDMAKVVDVSGMNHYPSRTPELAIDYYRGTRGTVWALEQHTRLGNVDTPDGYMPLWAWMTIAHGANAIVYVRWRQCRWGNEQFGDGLLPHSGQENRFYRELARLGAELKEVGDRVEQTRPHASVAVTYSYESRWGIEASGLSKGMKPVVEAADYHKALAKQVTAIDAMDPHEDLSPHALVIAPRLWMVDEIIAEKMKAYVEGGGVLCLTVGSWVVDAHGKSFDTPRPGLLDDLAGIKVSDLAYQKDLALPLTSSVMTEGGQLKGECMADEIHLDGAETIATHASGWRKGSPAITRHRKGKGQVVYVGVRLCASSIPVLVEWLCEISGIGDPINRPEGLSVYDRKGQGMRLRFFINWNDHEEVIHPGSGWRDAFSNEDVHGEVRVPPTDLRILLRDEKRMRPDFPVSHASLGPDSACVFINGQNSHEPSSSIR